MLNCRISDRHYLSRSRRSKLREDIANEILATTIDLVLSTVSQAIDTFVDFENKQLSSN